MSEKTVDVNMNVSLNFLEQFTTEALIHEIARRSEEKPSVDDFEPRGLDKSDDAHKCATFDCLYSLAKDYFYSVKDEGDYDYDGQDSIVRLVLNSTLGDGAAEAVDDFVVF